MLALLLVCVAGACAGSDSGDDDWVASEHVSDDSVEPLVGDYLDGTWTVYMDTDGRICGSLERPDEEVLGVCGSSDDLEVTMHDANGNPTVLFGMVPEGTVGLSTPDASRDSWAGWAGTETPDGRLIYAIVVQREPVPTEVMFWGSDGELIETVSVDR